MNKRQHYLHDCLLTLAYKVGPEDAVCEISQTRAASQSPSDMCEAVTEFMVTWTAVLEAAEA